MTVKKHKGKDGKHLKTVTEKIFEKFVDELEGDENLNEVAPRLKRVLDDIDSLNENSIRAALFIPENNDKD
ncbi:MAG: hypothetical protein CMI56_02220 [Parcubacteria group bacterium]|nr:hypothetical protein [Parcubacteria group bacterium]|tara:strand:- start:118 stop:330 length:213 start_codon:yes stop_codon:yes gene_type:complete